MDIGLNVSVDIRVSHHARLSYVIYSNRTSLYVRGAFLHGYAFVDI